MNRFRGDYASDFHDFEGVSYLNCAFHGAMPRVATQAVEAALQIKKTPHRIRFEDHFDYPDAFRSAVAEMIGADPVDIAVTGSATQGVMILVAGLDWRPGDEVVLPAGEFPANRLPWLSLERRGVVVREVSLPSDREPAERLAEALTERTRVVAASWVSYSTGRRIDIDRLAAHCRDAGVLLAVDASQGIGGLPFSVRETGCDVVICATYKWMLGPYGLGFAWVRPGLAERLELANVNWFSLHGARDSNRFSEVRLEFEPGARRFDTNEPGNFLNMAGGAAAARYINEVTPAAVHAHVGRLLDRLADGLPRRVRPVTWPHDAGRSNILCLAPESTEEGERLAERLQMERIVVSRREGALRVSPHLYNSERDVDRLLEVLEATAGLRRRAGAIGSRRGSRTV